MGYFSDFLKKIMPPDLSIKKLISDGATVIDVRSATEYASGHIENALHIPHNAIAQKIAHVFPDKEAPIIVYCHSGPRAAFALNVLEKAGYTQVVNGRSYSNMRRHLA